MLSKNLPHAYTHEGVRYYVLTQEVKTTKPDGTAIVAINFYLFDERGYVFFQITHALPAMMKTIGRIFRLQSVLEVKDTAWQTHPLIEPDDWIDGSPDRGYAIEIIREALGLNFQVLTDLIGKEI